MSDKEKEANIVIGEALLSLLESESESEVEVEVEVDISVESLTEHLRRVLETETDDDRRQSITDAIRQMNRLSVWGEIQSAQLHQIVPEQAERTLRSSGTLH